MIALLFGVIASALAAFAGIFGLLWLACYISDHDLLLMMHMYSSPIMLSVAFGIVLPLNTRKLPAIVGWLRRQAPFS